MDLSWTVKKAECRRMDAFELWLLEKTLKSPLDCNMIGTEPNAGDAVIRQFLDLVWLKDPHSTKPTTQINNYKLQCVCSATEYV